MFLLRDELCSLHRVSESKRDTCRVTCSSFLSHIHILPVVRSVSNPADTRCIYNVIKIIIEKTQYVLSSENTLIPVS